MSIGKNIIMAGTVLLVAANSVLPVCAEKIITADGISGGLSGSGVVEGYIEDEVMRVVLPYTDISFAVDPNGVLKKTNAVAVGGPEHIDFGTKEDGFVFFGKKVDGKMYYSSSTDLCFQNKSSFPVQVSVAATFDSGESGVILKQTASEFKGSDAGIRFSISDGTTTKSAVKSGSSPAYLSRSLTGINSEYSYMYQSGAYRFEMNQNSETVYPSYSVTLNSECDGKASAAWKNVDISKCRLSVIWKITRSDTAKWSSPYVKNMGISINSKNPSDVSMEIEFNNRTDVKLSSVIYQKSDSASVAMPGTSYTLDGNVLTIKASAFKNLQAGTYTYTLKFSDGSSDTVRIEIS